MNDGWNVAGQVYIKLQNLEPENKFVSLPEFKHGAEEDAGADVRSIETVLIPVGQTVLISLGFSMEIPRGYEVQVRPRSGLGKKGIAVANAPGTIDSGYRGPCAILLRNSSPEPFLVEAGDRIAQFVLNKVPVARYFWGDNLSDSKRGTGGFGSTGVR